MMSITPRQAEVLEAIRRRTRGGVPPSYAELKAELNIRSSGHLHNLLSGLKDRGLVTWEPARERTLRILGEMEGLERRSTADLLALRHRINTVLKGRAS